MRHRFPTAKSFSIIPAAIAVFLAGTAVAQEAPEESARTPTAIQREFIELNKMRGQAKTDTLQAENALLFCRLFVEIGEHPKIASSPTLQSLSVKTRVRLRSIEEQISKELRRRKIAEPAAMVADRQAFQRSRAAKRSGMASTGSERSSPSGAVTPAAAATASTGTTGATGATGAAGPGGLPDFGWGLVNLIRQTIRPDYWSVNGGKGKALYFGHSRALIIHGSWRVQEDVADLLGALRGEG